VPVDAHYTHLPAQLLLAILAASAFLATLDGIHSNQLPGPFAVKGSAHDLVTEHYGQLDAGMRAIGDVQVASAQAHQEWSNQSVLWQGRRVGERRDTELPCLLQDEGLHSNASWAGRLGTNRRRRADLRIIL
jgi:hypothetical protein